MIVVTPTSSFLDSRPLALADHALSAVFDIGFGAVVAAGEFAVPFPALVLVFDAFGLPGLALLGGNSTRSSDRR